jgi:hypothetical protein
MITFIGGLLIGGIVGSVTTMKFVNSKLEAIQETKTIYSSNKECQIHPSYTCIDSTECKGNPLLCESSILR